MLCLCLFLALLMVHFNELTVLLLQAAGVDGEALFFELEQPVQRLRQGLTLNLVL